MTSATAPDAGPLTSEESRVLTDSELFRGLPESAAQRLVRGGRRRRFARASAIFDLGEASAAMYVVLSGKVCVTRPAGHGRDNLLTLLAPGDLFGELTLFDPGPRRATATALSDVVAIEFTSAAVRNWLEAETDGAWHFLGLLARRVRRTNDALDTLLYGDIPRRVARALLDLAARFGQLTSEGVRVNHDLTQEQLAHFVGASRESVNKSLSDLAGRGVVRLEQRGLVVLDEARLRRKANG